MDERVNAVDPVQDLGVRKEPLLEANLPENPEALLNVDELEGMLASDVDGAFDESQRSECATNLVNLRVKQCQFLSQSSPTQTTKRTQ